MADKPNYDISDKPPEFKRSAEEIERDRQNTLEQMELEKKHAEKMYEEELEAAEKEAQEASDSDSDKKEKWWKFW